MLEREREQVAASARRLAALGLTLGTAGNVSMRAGERILVTPTGAVLERVRADEISIVDRRRRVARRAAADLRAGAASRRLRPLWAGRGRPRARAGRDGAGVACSTRSRPSITRWSSSADRSGSPATRRSARVELATATLDAMHGRTAVLMANHGTLTYGDDLEPGRRPRAAVGVGLHAVLARGGDRHAPVAGRAAARRRPRADRPARLRLAARRETNEHPSAVARPADLTRRRFVTGRGRRRGRARRGGSGRGRGRGARRAPDRQTAPTRRVDVVVVGAGLAGLVAATQLTRSGPFGAGARGP